MAKKKRKKAASTKRRKVKARKGFSGKSKKKKSSAGGSRFNLDTVTKMALSAGALRLLGGTAYYFARKQGVYTPKVRIIVPAAAAWASAKGYLPKMEGFTAMAVGQAVDATIDTVQTLKDVFDLKFLDKPAAPKPTAGMSPRSYIETARQIQIAEDYSKAGMGYEKAGIGMVPGRINYER